MVRYVLVLVVLSGALGAAAQVPNFSSRSEFVVVDVTVKDKKGGYVQGLSRDSFKIFEDGRPQTVQVFTNEDAPVTVGLVIDNSSSMQPNRDRVITAAAAFAHASHPEDELCALTFNERVRPVLPADSPFAQGAALLREALIRGITAQGRTALYDGIAAGLSYVGKGHYERRVLVLVGDGGDNASTTTFADVLRQIERLNTVVYTVALIDPVDSDADPKRLARIARTSGGESFAPRDASQVTEVLQRIALDIRRTYTIGYVSTNTARDGTFRRLRVVVDPPDHRAVRVRTRAGYVADGSTEKEASAPHEP